MTGPQDADRQALPAAYLPVERPRLESSEELRARIPGWGADLDPADRPAVPRERFDPGATGAHWEFPERQPETHPRERSLEHLVLPPVFGSTLPPHGLSGAVRRYAYARHSEAKAMHWLLLVLADRIDVAEHVARSWATTRPDQPVTQSGVLSERRRSGLASRLGQGRSDLPHQALDPVLNAAPWVAGGLLAASAGRRLVRGLVRRLG